jgi:hypothetical protein
VIDALRRPVVLTVIGGLLVSGEIKLGTTNAVPNDDVDAVGAGFGDDFVSRENEAFRERPELLALEAVVVEPVDDWEVLVVRREPLLVLGRLDVGVLFPPPNMDPFLEKMPPLASFGNASMDRSILGLGLCLERGVVPVLVQSRPARRYQGGDRPSSGGALCPALSLAVHRTVGSIATEDVQLRRVYIHDAGENFCEVGGTVVHMCDRSLSRQGLLPSLACSVYSDALSVRYRRNTEAPTALG